MEILNKPVCAEPRNQVAKDLRADNCEQLGYHYESPSLRNSSLPQRSYATAAAS